MIELSDDKVIFAFGAATKPVFAVRSGETVRIRTKDCFSEQIRTYDDSLTQIDWDAVNPATGPIAVKGAVPGGALKVEILDIELNEQAVCSTGKGEGVYGDRLEEESFRLCAVRDGRVWWDDSLSIPVSPMIGVIGVAPAAGEVNCGTPGPHGGNMDNNKITAGTTVYFPVFTEGALFGCGDMHAAMGNGEIGVSGAEIGGWVTLRLTAEPDLSIATPWFETDEEIGVICSSATLDDAADDAVHAFIDRVAKRTGKDPSELAMLFSIAGNVEVCQMVDPLRTVRFTAPKRILDPMGFTL